MRKWGKGGRCVALTNLPPSCADCLEIWELQLPGTLKTCPGIPLDDTWANVLIVNNKTLN
jgi:hypothetical protein